MDNLIDVFCFISNQLVARFCHSVSKRCNELASLKQYSMLIPLERSVWERCRVTASSDLSPAQPKAQAPVSCVIHALYSWTLTWKECHTRVIPSFYAPFHFMVWLIYKIQVFGFAPDLSSHVLLKSTHNNNNISKDSFSQKQQCIKLTQVKLLLLSPEKGG